MKHLLLIGFLAVGLVSLQIEAKHHKKSHSTDNHNKKECNTSCEKKCDKKSQDCHKKGSRCQKY